MKDAALISYNKVIKLNPTARNAFIAKSRAKVLAWGNIYEKKRTYR
jgi:hypothetical protein